MRVYGLLSAKLGVYPTPGDRADGPVYGLPDYPEAPLAWRAKDRLSGVTVLTQLRTALEINDIERRLEHLEVEARK